MKTIFSITLIMILVSVLTSCNQKEYYYSEDLKENGEVYTLYGKPVNGYIVFEGERFNELSSGDDEVVGSTIKFEEGKVVSINHYYENSEIDSITVEGTNIGIYRNLNYTVDYKDSEYNQFYKTGELWKEGGIKNESFTRGEGITFYGELKEYTKDGETISVSNYSDEYVKYEYLLEDSLISKHKMVMYDLGNKLSEKLQGYMLTPESLRNDFDFYGQGFGKKTGFFQDRIDEKYINEFTYSIPTGVITLSGNPNPNDNNPLMLTGYPTLEYNTQNMDDIDKRLNQSITTLKLRIKPTETIWEE